MQISCWDPEEEAEQAALETGVQHAGPGTLAIAVWEQSLDNPAAS